MDTVIRSAVVYLFMLVVFRISGKRSLSQITTFDFVLLLIISEATQQALVGNDFSDYERIRRDRDADHAGHRFFLDGGPFARF